MCHGGTERSLLLPGGRTWELPRRLCAPPGGRDGEVPFSDMPVTKLLACISLPAA